MAKEKKNRFFIRFNKVKKAYQICDSTVRPGLDVIALVSGLSNAEWFCKDLNSHDELVEVCGKLLIGYCGMANQLAYDGPFEGDQTTQRAKAAIEKAR